MTAEEWTETLSEGLIRSCTPEGTCCTIPYVSDRPCTLAESDDEILDEALYHHGTEHDMWKMTSEGLGAHLIKGSVRHEYNQSTSWGELY